MQSAELRDMRTINMWIYIYSVSQHLLFHSGSHQQVNLLKFKVLRQLDVQGLYIVMLQHVDVNLCRWLFICQISSGMVSLAYLTQ